LFPPNNFHIFANMTHRFQAYGLNFVSDTPLPGLPQEYSGFEAPPIILNLGPEPDWVRRALRLQAPADHARFAGPVCHESGLTLTSLGSGEFFQLSYGDGTRFVLDASADHLWGTCPASLTTEDLATYLFGPVMGFILRRRRVLPLHASAVAVGGQAVVLCGESAAGKSTTAAALALRGFTVLTEDISPVQEKNGIPSVEPGYPRICLWPDAVEKLFGAPEALPQLTPNWEKCFLALDGVRAKFEPKRQPLGAVYILAPRTAEADAPRIETLDKREALLELVQNTYMNWLLDRAQRAAELDALARIVTRVPVSRIVPHSEPARMGALCDLIVADAERLFASRDSRVLIPTH
jgi:hypothetical protein